MKKIIILIILSAFLFCSACPAYSADDESVSIANELYKQGLLKGSGVDSDGQPVFGLDKYLTRQEAITLLVRLRGAEEEALNGSWDNSFTDVDDWAKPYVGYAYANRITKGMSEDYFGAHSNVTAAQYITFILNSIGYSSDYDFSWDRAWELSDHIGITCGEYNSENNTSFLRGDAVKITYFASLYLQAIEAEADEPAEPETDPSVLSLEEIVDTDDSFTDVYPDNEEGFVLQEFPDNTVYEGDPNLVEEALKYEGYPYVAGGKNPSGFDCSGFCIYVLKQSGYKFTAGSSDDLYCISSPVSTEDVREGDLVFFKGTYATDKVSHSGIYIGNGKMIHAGTSKTGVCIVSLSEKYWSDHFFSFGRMEQ